MAIQKPPVLRDWLARWNFVIFTWKVYIGDVVENAIDWTISWINYVLNWAEIAYNWAKAAWDKAVQVWNDLTVRINTEVQKLLNKIDTWWSQLNTWWAARSSEVRGWISAASDRLQLYINDISFSLQRLNTAWDTFRVDLLSRIPSWTELRDFITAGINEVKQWFTLQRQNISDEIETNIKPVRDQVNKQTSWLDMIKKLFTDPEEFILELLVKIW